MIRFRKNCRKRGVGAPTQESESRNRMASLPDWTKKAIACIAIAWTAFQLYTAYFGLRTALIQRSTTLSFGLVLCFLCFKLKRGDEKKVAFYDWILAALAAVIPIYFALTFDTLVVRGGNPTKMDIILGAVLICLVLEATRRSVGLPLVIVAGAFLVYALAGPYLPSLIAHRGYSISRVATQIFLTAEGIYGTPMSVMTSFVFAFIVFGCFLEVTGGAKLFINFAFALTGKFIGGPAKTAIVASGLLGTISGSGLANVVTTGTFTIPLMKECGYKPSFAGGVEASSSSAGQIMPPVMGAAAFIMAETTGLSYLRICLAAAIPAILYYFSVFLSVDFEARRTHMGTIDGKQVPSLGASFKSCYPLLFPIATLVVLLLMGYTALKAAIYATAVMCLTSFLNEETRLTPKRLLQAVCQSAYNAVTVCVACAVCGIVTGIITMTGLGLKLSNVILQLSGQDLLVTMLLTMVASVILGMGLPTTAKYIVLAAVAAPALVRLGVPLVGAHLFILYFGVIAEVTPPVALTSYAAAAIAKSPNVETALQGLKISISAFFIPFMFCFYPALLFEDVTLNGMAIGLLCSFIGVVCLSAAAIGYYFGKLQLWARAIMFCGAILVIHTEVWSDILGIVILVLMAVYQWFRWKQISSKEAGSETI